MATKTFEELKQLAIQIRDEKTNKQNTATRIGTQMLEHLNKLEQDYYDKTATDEKLKQRDEKLTELSSTTNTKFTELESNTINTFKVLYNYKIPTLEKEEDGYVISHNSQIAKYDNKCKIVKYNVSQLIGKKIRVIGLFNSSLNEYGAYAQSTSISSAGINVSLTKACSGITFIDDIVTIEQNYLFVSVYDEYDVVVAEIDYTLKTDDNSKAIKLLNSTILDIAKFTGKTSYNDFISAISDVPEEYRKSGLIITFPLVENDVKRNKIYQYVRPAYTEDAWNDEENSWSKIVDSNDVKIYYTKEEANSEHTKINNAIENSKLTLFKSTNYYIELISSVVNEGYVIGTTNIAKPDASCSIKRYNVSHLIGKTVRIIGQFNSSVPEYSAYAQGETTSSSTIDIETVKKCSGLTFIDDIVTISNNYLSVSFYDNCEVLVIETYRSIKERKSYWTGKTILWLGTSIPEGKDTAIGSESTGKSYPQIVGELLGANVINNALGSSMARRSTRTGDYANSQQDNLLRSLSQTLEEKQYIYDNWETIKGTLQSVTKDTLSEDDKEQMFSASFENRLLPYLDGTKPMPDLFVFDHGHNDFKTYYSLENGDSDLTTDPNDTTVPSIFAEDINMTSNNNEGLVKYFGSLDNINPRDLPTFIKSINRNSYIGAINFLITLILRYNPKAKIVFIGEYRSWSDYEPVHQAQLMLAESWQTPICKLWDYTRYSNHVIPGTKNYWIDSGTSSQGYTGYDLDQFRCYIRDGAHPHSDTTGKAIELHAGVIAEFFKSIR